MSDDLDDLDAVIRRAAASLDHQTPAGYFDTLADRTLARLDDDRDELARARALRAEGAAPPGPDTAPPLPGAEAAPVAPRQRAPRARAIAAVVGIAVAAAAAVVIVLSVRDEGRAPGTASGVTAASGQPLADAAVPAVAPIPPAPSDQPAPPPAPPRAPDLRVTPPVPPPGPDKPVTPPGKPAPPRKTKQPGDLTKTPANEPGQPETIDDKTGIGTKKGKATRPVPTGKGKTGKTVGPTGPIRKSPTGLTDDDLQRGMDAVAARTRACFAGAPGEATLQLTVSPSGQVTRVTVSGGFAGTPVASCLEQAVASATFPSWQGGAQTFSVPLRSE